MGEEELVKKVVESYSDNLRLQGVEERILKEFCNGRPIIHFDSKVDGGIYLGKHEAIVVDSQLGYKIKELYKVAKGKAVKNGRVEEYLILKAVYDTVKETMSIQSQDAVNDILLKYDVRNRGKIPLDVFLEEGAGVSRHDALACAVLLELFKKDKFIEGSPSIARNSDRVWCKYTNPKNEIYILDVEFGFFGKLEESLQKDLDVYKKSEIF